jgi:hypothetical protein
MSDLITTGTSSELKELKEGLAILFKYAVEAKDVAGGAAAAEVLLKIREEEKAAAKATIQSAPRIEAR